MYRRLREGGREGLVDIHEAQAAHFLLNHMQHSFSCSSIYHVRTEIPTHVQESQLVPSWWHQG